MPMNKPRVIVPGVGKQSPSRPVPPNARKRITASLEAAVKDFNERFPVGTAVVLRKDTETIRTVVEHPAEILGGHSAVAWFQGVRGAYSIVDRVQPVEGNSTGNEG